MKTALILCGLAACMPPQQHSGTNAPLAIDVTISGETLGENGLPLVPVNQGDPQFVDGWSVTFEKYIVVVGNIRLSPNALEYQTWQTLNAIVASEPGPYVVDVHQLSTSGPNGLDRRGR